MEVGCWAHARRKFYEARATDPERALYGLGVIRQLYAVERQAEEDSTHRRLGREEGWWLRLRLRQERALPLLTSLCQWLRGQRAQVLPKSPIGKILRRELRAEAVTSATAAVETQGRELS